MCSFYTCCTYIPLNPINYKDQWPFNANYLDVVGTYNGSLAASTLTFINDRFGNTQSALQFSNGGYVSLPSAIYFNGVSFTVSLWLHVSTRVSSAIMFSFRYSTTDQLTCYLFSTSGNYQPSLTTAAGSQSSATLNPGFMLTIGKHTYEHRSLRI